MEASRRKHRRLLLTTLIVVVSLPVAWFWLAFGELGRAEGGAVLSPAIAEVGAVVVLLALIPALAGRWRLWLVVEAVALLIVLAWIAVSVIEGSRRCDPECPPLATLSPVQ